MRTTVRQNGFWGKNRLSIVPIHPETITSPAAKDKRVSKVAAMATIIRGKTRAKQTTIRTNRRDLAVSSNRDIRTMFSSDTPSRKLAGKDMEKVVGNETNININQFYEQESDGQMTNTGFRMREKAGADVYRGQLCHSTAESTDPPEHRS